MTIFKQTFSGMKQATGLLSPRWHDNRKRSVWVVGQESFSWINGSIHGLIEWSINTRQGRTLLADAMVAPFRVGHWRMPLNPIPPDLQNDNNPTN